MSNFINPNGIFGIDNFIKNSVRTYSNFPKIVRIHYLSATSWWGLFASALILANTVLKKGGRSFLKSFSADRSK